jgi:hypothetical protein
MANDEVGRLEKALADLWAEENKPRGYLNYGQGILQDLFFKPRDIWGCGVCEHEVTKSERYVAATVVQWLGTSCGRAFLEDAFKRAGWKLILLPNT